MSEIIGNRRLQIFNNRDSYLYYSCVTCKTNEWDGNELSNNYDSINLVIMGQKSL